MDHCLLNPEYLNIERLFHVSTFLVFDWLLKNLSYCWFARDVTAAMLVDKNKSIFLLWELNAIFM